MLEVDGLTRRYGDKIALNGLRFTVPSRELYGFVGPNGAGKSTTMRAVLKLTTPESGEVRWRGQPYGRRACRRFGYMPEERGLYPRMTIGRQLSYFGRMHGLNRTDAESATTYWLGRLGLGDRIDDNLDSLSLGNQQRVQIAAALVHAPELLVLDEPFSGLDPVAADELTAVLMEEADRGSTVLFSSHQLDQVEAICRSVAIVNNGRVVASGQVDELLTEGNARLAVEVAGDPSGHWASRIGGVQITENRRGRLRLLLGPDVNSQFVLRQAIAAGPVTHFGFERRRLSELFRDTVGGSIDEQGRLEIRRSNDG